MAKIEKTVENERMITATFTQSEWNELFAAFATTYHESREHVLIKYDLPTDYTNTYPLYEFMKKEIR